MISTVLLVRYGDDKVAAHDMCWLSKKNHPKYHQLINLMRCKIVIAIYFVPNLSYWKNILHDDPEGIFSLSAAAFIHLHYICGHFDPNNKHEVLIVQ